MSSPKSSRKGSAKGQRRALGRGLDALLPSNKPETKSYGQKAVFECAIERIVPRRDQPRQHFDDEALVELAATIAEHGVIQPLVVRRLTESGRDETFEIIAGERRWRASQRAGLKQVPVVVKDVSPETAFELALIENVQRQDLNPIEVAESYQRLLDDLAYTQEDLATRVGKSRVAITNVLRLLKLPGPVRNLLVEGTLSEGHGRALLGAPDEETMLDLAVKASRGRLSVRKTEALVKQARREGPNEARPPKDEGKSAAVRDVENRITRRLGARASVDHKGKGGTITVRYADLDELDRILDSLDA